VSQLPAKVRQVLGQGRVIPAHPLALDAARRLDERRQRALSRYYVAAGAGGLAVGVHTTQFAIRKAGLFRPVLELAAEVMARQGGEDFIRIAGAIGPTRQAVAEAELAKELGYHAVLLSLAALKGAGEETLMAHCRQVAQVMPMVGFYLQPAVGGRVLSYGFWRRFAELEAVVAIKIAPFNRYQTLEVVRAVAEAGRAGEIALYTGNDDAIALDLLTPHVFACAGKEVEVRMVGGLLGHWAVWTSRAVELLEECQRIVAGRKDIPQELLKRAVQVTDCNAAFFDAANGFAGCIAGIHEVLRRQGLLEGIWCLDPEEGLSPGQGEEIERVYRAYPHLNDDEFVAEHLDEWLE
jgi:dihydrodipicolinate synthase/N-acetylneuraminate lyase